MKITTLKEYAEKIHTKEKMIKEDRETASQIEIFAQALYERIAQGGDVKILTDYDCDGITSAFIMERLVNAVNPSVNVEVICNDRRNSYGVPKNVKASDNTAYIVLDTGSNELDYLKETYGKENIFMADHHLVEQAHHKDEITQSKNLLNPHALHPDDKENAQYCAAGLAYRVYQVCSEYVKEFRHDAKRDNTVAVMAAIGTIGDVVDLMDMNSYNRAIVKDGMHRIDNATEDNLDYPIGYLLRKNGISDVATNAKQIAFNVVSYINAASRMSEYMGINGAQKMYDALAGDPRNPDTYFKMDDLQEINSLKKSICNELQNTSYYNFIASEMDTDSTCLIYPINTDVESALYNGEHSIKVLHSMAGILAGRIAEATEKAAICFVYHKDGDYWSGSGRNAEGNESLKRFVDLVAASDEGKDLKITYGGHEDAIGISRLEGFDGLQKFITAVNANKDLLIRRSDFEKVYLNMPVSELNSPKTLNTLMELQPIGTGNNIPPVIVTGKLRNETKDSIVAKNPHWAKRIVDTEDGRVTVKDWNYNPSNYVTNNIGKSRFVQGETTFVATMDINIYRGKASVELTKKTDMDYHREHSLVLAAKKEDPKKTASKKNVERI